MSLDQYMGCRHVQTPIPCPTLGASLPPVLAVHTFAEFKVATTLESAMEHAFLTESNEGMTATDTQKNTVYYVAKQVWLHGVELDDRV